MKVFTDLVAETYVRSCAIAMLSGGVSQESIVLNIESLWSGGPFANKVSQAHPLSDYLN